MASPLGLCREQQQLLPTCSWFFIYAVVQFYLWYILFLNQYKIFWTSTNFLNQYKIFWTGTKSFSLGWFNFFCFCFCVKPKKYFWHLWSALHFPSSLHLHSTYPHPLFPPCSPHMPAPILFTSMLTLWALNHWPLDSCPDALPVSHGDLDARSPIFYIYTVLVIHFLKLFKSVMYVGPSPSQC